jgi:hypothetical protein
LPSLALVRPLAKFCPGLLVIATLNFIGILAKWFQKIR